MTDIVTLKSIARMIDQSLLHPTVTDSQIEQGCKVALKYGVATVCVKPYAIEAAGRLLAGSQVGVCAVTAFPHGNSSTSMKIEETVAAIRSGATEIDTVINVGKALGGDWDYVSEEVGLINKATVENGAILKLIFENDYLEDEHIVRLCEICAEHKVAFAKTSTGYGFVKVPDGHFSYHGATEKHVKLMRDNLPPEVQVKAAGGVRTLDDLLRMRALGATRIGATATDAIMEEARRRGIN